MRRAVGLSALSLPFVLAIGNIVYSLLGPAHALPHPLLQRTISDYYFTPMRNYYVGALCAIGAFLASSRGYDLHDEVTGYLAGAFAFGLAFFPSFDPYSHRYSTRDVELGFTHTVFAALLFSVLAYVCIFLFRKSSPAQPFTHHKRNRNRIYGACGLTLIVCMAVMTGLSIRSTLERRHPSHLLFWCETFGLIAFGVAWLTKGEGILRDRPHNPKHQNHDHQEDTQLNHGNELHA
jgi:hypothetical protein